MARVVNGFCERCALRCPPNARHCVCPGTSPSEAMIKDMIREYFGLRDDMRLFNNPVGSAVTEFDGRIPYGLAPGSSDLIGWVTINGVAMFLALEVKSATGRASQAQLDFITLVNQMGGIAGVVRSVDDCRHLLLSRGWAA